MDAPQLAMSDAGIEAFCLRHHVRKLSLFGSILTPRFRSESDIDVLVEFEPGRVPGAHLANSAGTSATKSSLKPPFSIKDSDRLRLHRRMLLLALVKDRDHRRSGQQGFARV